MSDANVFAALALLLWAPLSAAGFGLARPAVAAAALLLGALMFLPERVAFNLPGVPPLGKQEVATLCVLLGCLLRHTGRLAAARPGRGLEALVLVLVALAIGTGATNGDPLPRGPRELGPMGLYDGLSMGVRDVLRLGIPFFLGRALFRSPRDLRDLMTLLVGASLVYSLLVLFELRMSPQLHRWVYGFGQQSWLQWMRSGGYRPVVFMAHGLALAVFVAVTTLAATSLWRARLSIFAAPAGLAAAYLGVLLALCKSLAALVYGLALVPIVACARPRLQLGVAAALGALVLAYPVLQLVQVFPTEALVEVANAVDERRARSLAFRFHNEAQLIEKAESRLWLGWGTRGRGRLYDQQTGREVSVTDSFWIIQLVNRGLPATLASLALLVVPIFVAARSLRRVRGTQVQILFAGLALMIAVYAVDLLPNGLFTNFPYFLSGALLGLGRGLVRPSRPPPGELEARRAPAGPLPEATPIAPRARPRLVE